MHPDSRRRAGIQTQGWLTLPAIRPLCAEVDVVSVWLTDLVPAVWGPGVMNDSRVRWVGQSTWPSCLDLASCCPALSVSVVLSWCLKFMSPLPALLPAPSLEGSLHSTVLDCLGGGIVSGKAEPTSPSGLYLSH